MTNLAKLLNHQGVDEWIAIERAAEHRIGFTCGAFDIMHAGHAQYLAEARSLCDCLLVAVNSDDSIRRYKNPLRPVNPWAERAFVVAAMTSVDRVTVLDEDRPLSLIERWKPDLYIKGGDYKVTSLQSGSIVAAYGGRTVVIPPQFESNTSSMFDRIQTLGLHAVPEATEPGSPAGLVLLDRDGTLVRDACFDPTEVEILPGVIEGLKSLQRAGFRLCLVSNQQGIGLGYFGYPEFIDGNRKLLRKLGSEGISIRKIYFCPHSFQEQCSCRKPEPGLILRALREQKLTPDRCFVIGDDSSDVAAALAAGCTGLLLKAGSSITNMSAAAEAILRTASATTR